MGGLSVGEPIPELRRTPDEVDLFLVSAAMWVPHRIHYDRDWCRREGHRGLLVHGPLQGAYLGQMVSTWAQGMGGRLVRLRYRNRRPVFAGESLVCRGLVTGVDSESAPRHGVCDVWVERASDGERTTVGLAEVQVP